MNLQRRFIVAALSLCLPGLGCGGASSSGDVVESEDELRTTYGDLFETLPDADLNRWIGVRRSLVSGFDRICGDTLCSGDFSNLTTVRLTCSSTRVARKMKDCVWVLGGNIDYVDGATGAITTEARAFSCHIPVAGHAKTMLDALAGAGDDALDVPLPGTGTSFYDALVDCFSGVVGAPPPASTGDDFAELGDVLWEQSSSAGTAWLTTKRDLTSAFDDACGDTFCEGDYPDITALRLACAVNRTNQDVSRCAWTFAFADTSVDARGRITTRTDTKTCSVEIGAPASALTSALAGADALHVKLPGRATSLYDALVDCL